MFNLSKVLLLLLGSLVLSEAMHWKHGHHQQMSNSEDPNGRVIRDAEGRHLILHGVNVVYKIAPYIPDRETWDG